MPRRLPEVCSSSTPAVTAVSVCYFFHHETEIGNISTHWRIEKIIRLCFCYLCHVLSAGFFFFVCFVLLVITWNLLNISLWCLTSPSAAVGPAKIAQSCHQVLAAPFSICSTDKRSTQTFTRLVHFGVPARSSGLQPRRPRETSFHLQSEATFLWRRRRNPQFQRSCDPHHQPLLYLVHVRFY